MSYVAEFKQTVDEEAPRPWYDWQPNYQADSWNYNTPVITEHLPLSEADYRGISQFGLQVNVSADQPSGEQYFLGFLDDPLTNNDLAKVFTRELARSTHHNEGYSNEVVLLNRPEATGTWLGEQVRHLDVVTPPTMNVGSRLRIIENDQAEEDATSDGRSVEPQNTVEVHAAPASLEQKSLSYDLDEKQLRTALRLYEAVLREEHPEHVMTITKPGLNILACVDTPLSFKDTFHRLRVLRTQDHFHAVLRRLLLIHLTECVELEGLKQEKPHGKKQRAVPPRSNGDGMKSDVIDRLIVQTYPNIRTDIWSNKKEQRAVFRKERKSILNYRRSAKHWRTAADLYGLGIIAVLPSKEDVNSTMWV